MMSLLPDDIMVEIFSLLPDKYLLRCKLLSKHCYSLISRFCFMLKKPRVIALFVRTRFNVIEEHQMIARYSDLVFLTEYFTKDLIRMKCAQGVIITNYVSLETQTLLRPPILGWEDDDLMSSYGLPFRPVPDELLGSCNGLLLFLDMDSNRYYVSNPATRQSVPIPLPPFEQKTFFYAALAFDPSPSTTTCCYKILRLEWIYLYPNVILDVYSSATRSWSRQELPFDLSLRKWSLLKAIMYFHGALFRLSRTWHIIRFGLEEEKVSMDFIDLPLTYKQCSGLMGCMGVLMGQFCYANEISKVVHVWSLEEESDVGRWWNLKHKINIYDMTSGMLLNRANAPDICQWVGPIAFDPNSNVVYMGSSLAILRCNLDDNTVEEVARVEDYNKFIPGYYCPALTYARFLIPFNADGDIPNPIF